MSLRHRTRCLLLAALALSCSEFGTAPARADTGAVLVIAHRGASGYVPEHTLAAKAMAHAMGADYIEQDVVLSKDGIPVVLHDITLNATTNVAEIFPGRARADGLFYAIDFLLAELKQLDVLERGNRQGEQAFKGRFPRQKTGLTIPTLAEELAFIRGMNASTGRVAGIYPELKSPAFHREEGHDLAAAVLRVLEDAGYSADDAVYLQSFDFSEIKRVRNELGYKGKLVQLIGENAWNMAPGTDYDQLRKPEGLKEIASVANGIGPSLTQVLTDDNKDGIAEVTSLVADAKAAGLEVHPYTFRADRLPPFAATFSELIQLAVETAGVDGLFTDQPDQARAALGK
ncbi:glycerophosphodiester phosphodiesterase [Pannonibacter carbonis]|uniref:glycerophosphodiester phosphodiesterase n=1 Tax=Pannonibacter carbonis TaxID=2067569 RepID=UPI000D107697|nr:glycerophosphodiester phosphodiesterase [Pannonibacter carbonis]